MYVQGGELQGRLYDVVGKHQAHGLNTIHFTADVRAPRDSSQLLSIAKFIYTDEWSYLHAIHGLDHLDMSQAENVYGMFANDTAIETLDISSWDVSQVRDFSYMFHGMSNLTTLQIADWNTSSAVKMRGMFDNVGSLTRLELTNWCMQNVQDMSWMFTEMRGLSRLDLSTLDMSQVQDTNAMFLWMNSKIHIKSNSTLHLQHGSGVKDYDIEIVDSEQKI